jgi:hypothetical protein
VEERLMTEQEGEERIIGPEIGERGIFIHFRLFVLWEMPGDMAVLPVGGTPKKIVIRSG